jgi:hypothetical protein
MITSKRALDSIFSFSQFDDAFVVITPAIPRIAYFGAGLHKRRKKKRK